MDNLPGWLQFLLAAITAAVTAIIGAITATLRFSARLQRTDEKIADLELRMERRIADSRHQIMETIQRVVIVPSEKLEDRVTEQGKDIAVLKDRSSLRQP